MNEIKYDLIVAIKVIPNSGSNKIVGFENDALKVKILAPPEKGEANAALIAFLAKEWKMSKSQFTLIRGATSCHKLLKIQIVAETPAILSRISKGEK